MLTTDYLIVGSGAIGMTFADQLLTETNASITIIDRHHMPGGHWNNAYSLFACISHLHFMGSARPNSVATGLTNLALIKVITNWPPARSFG